MTRVVRGLPILSKGHKKRERVIRGTLATIENGVSKKSDFVRILD